MLSWPIEELNGHFYTVGEQLQTGFGPAAIMQMFESKCFCIIDGLLQDGTPRIRI